MYCCIDAYITHLYHDQNETIVYVSAEQFADDGFEIEYVRILLLFVYQLHCYPFLHPSVDDSSDTQADSENACIVPEQPPVRTLIYDTPNLDNHSAGKPIGNEYFDVINHEIDLLAVFSCEEDYRLAHWGVKCTLRRATINEHFRNPPMATISNFTSSYTLFKRLNEMSYTMAIDSWKCDTVCYTCFADRKNLRNNDYRRFFYCNRIE